MTFIDFSINHTFTLKFRGSGLVCRLGCEIPEDHACSALSEGQYYLFTDCT